MNHQLSCFVLSICIILLAMGCIKQKQDTQSTTNAEEIKETSVVYAVPAIENVIIKRDVEYFSDQEARLTVDMYYPPGFNFESNLPAVLIVFGFSNDVQNKFIGRRFKDTSWYRSWSKLIAASGMVALLYETDAPEKDLNILLHFL